MKRPGIHQSDGDLGVFGVVRKCIRVDVESRGCEADGFAGLQIPGANGKGGLLTSAGNGGRGARLACGDIVAFGIGLGQTGRVGWSGFSLCRRVEIGSGGRRVEKLPARAGLRR